MSIEPKTEEANMSHQSGDERDNTSTDFEAAESEDADSMIAEPGNDDYQNLHTAGVDTAAPTVGGDITNGSPDEKVPSRTELFGIDPIQELDGTDHERYEADTGTVQLDMAQDLAGIGASCSDEALYMVRDW